MKGKIDKKNLFGVGLLVALGCLFLSRYQVWFPWCQFWWASLWRALF